MKNLIEYYQEYKKSKTSVSFYRWLEGNVTSISELANDLGFSSIEELRIGCKKINKT